MSRVVFVSKKFISCSVITTLLLGCSSTSVLNNFDELAESVPLYLRGVFNWWEVDPKFQLKETDQVDVFAQEIHLIADGHPYDFKVADNDWSATLNCGAKSESFQLLLDSEAEMYCGADSKNLQFTPQVTGMFRFTINFSETFPSISVHRIK